MADTQQAPVFTIEKLYVKDISLEVPHSPHVYTWREQQQVNLDLNSEAKRIDEGIYEVVLTVTVTAKVGDKVAFLIEVSQGGLFQIRNVREQELNGALGAACPNILLPYLREVVSDLAVRGGFPPVIINPINFEAVHRQQAQAQQATKQ